MVCISSTLCAAVLVWIGIGRDVFGLRNVRLSVSPPTVKRGEGAALDCIYDLEDAPLYSFKLYRGYHEFYRFSPNHVPENKAFPLPGVTVDLARSNASRAVLHGVGFHFSGNITCEVTTDAPDFVTVAVSKDVMVVELPEDSPLLMTERNKYEPGETLRANCSSLPSRPVASLSFLLNNAPVNATISSSEQDDEWRSRSRISLELPLSSWHFSAGGQLDLKCTALVGEFYLDTRTVQLGSRSSGPVPERVVFGSSSSHNPVNFLILIVTYASTFNAGVIS